VAVAEQGDWTYMDFAAGKTPLPSPNLAWNTYGTGIESIGVEGAPEPVEIPSPAADQLLIRVDAVGLCFSDVKLIKQGGDHPKLYGRDLKVEPTRLGHEVSVTVIEVGTDLADTYTEGQRLAIQPDIYVDGRAAAYGYTVPGGLIQYHLIGPEVLAADHGAYVIPVTDEIGYAAAALSEPWACVEASYTQRRRLEPLVGGTMLIIGDGNASTVYTMSRGLDAPARIILSNVSDTTRELVHDKRSPSAEVIERNGVGAADVAGLSEELTGGEGFDDIIVLDPRHADLMEELGKAIAFRGTMNMVGTTPLDGLPLVDVGRLHYHYTAFIGTTGPDIAGAYGEERNRCDVIKGGTALFVGAAGPMGQMHMQRAIEFADGPSVLIGSDLDDDRIEAARTLLAPLAEEHGRTLIFINPGNEPGKVADLVEQHAAGGADDVIVTVPVGPVMAQAGEWMGPDGMLVLFAGVPNGTMAPLDLSDTYLHNAQFTGTSGSSIDDQATVLEKALDGSLSPGRALAAVGGIEAGQSGVRALMEGDYAGKVVIFPQLSGLELQSLEELAAHDPDIAAALGENNTWTDEAERILFEKYHTS
jgi:threonine dehydrogenase-like Zn-dependent dehydrogenase